MDENFFTPENACPGRRDEHASPSGKYKLVITPYGTKPGCWSYSRGEVYEGDKLIADVKRNYSSFPASWIENHPNGRSYLVCGADYQGQTVVELDTGKRRDFIPPEAEKGAGFCWVAHRFYPEHKILVVDGCIWACPYEFRFYDFSDPMESGWPELSIEIDGEPSYVDADDRWPEIDADGTFRCFSTEEDKESDTGTVQNSISLFRKEGQKLVRFSEWVSDAEQERRRQQAENERKWQEWLKNFRSSDPLYLKCRELVKNPLLHPEEYESYGVTHKDWCPNFNGNERRCCKRIHSSGKDSDRKTLDLEWAVDTGPIKLIRYVGGDTKDETFFEHSVDGMEQAFKKAFELFDGS